MTCSVGDFVVSQRHCSWCQSVERHLVVLVNRQEFPQSLYCIWAELVGGGLENPDLMIFSKVHVKDDVITLCMILRIFVCFPVGAFVY